MKNKQDKKGIIIEVEFPLLSQITRCRRNRLWESDSAIKSTVINSKKLITPRKDFHFAVGLLSNIGRRMWGNVLGVCDRIFVTWAERDWKIRTLVRLKQRLYRRRLWTAAPSPKKNPKGGGCTQAKYRRQIKRKRRWRRRGVHCPVIAVYDLTGYR